MKGDGQSNVDADVGQTPELRCYIKLFTNMY